jgi:hypothetical protein
MIKQTVFSLAATVIAVAAHAQKIEMTFFVTSTGLGRGADLGGLTGADLHCTTLARAAGAGNKTWRAYLSNAATGVEHARDRIGKGPWHNAKLELIASNVEELHGNNHINKQTALDEKGAPIKGRGDSPNMHDILTGSQADGRAFPGAQETTCRNWTSSSEGTAIVGHHDRMGLTDDALGRSWNSSHPTSGCSQEALRATGGEGLIYCFATN